MKNLLRLSLIPATLFSPNLFAQEATVFIEEAGIVVVEIETAPAVSGWHQSKDFIDYRGSGHYEWTGPANMNIKKAGDGILSYHFTITNAGNYEFRLRSYIGDGNNNTESNDSWVRFPSGRNIGGEHNLDGWTKAYMNKLGEWTWITKTVDNVGKSLRQYFTAGDHTIEISGRSTGHVIDRFALFKYDSVSFDNNLFDDAPQSNSTLKTVQQTTPSSTEVPIDVNETEVDEPIISEANNSVQQSTTDTVVNNANAQATIPSTPSQWVVAANQANANECSANKISLQALSDIYADSGAIKYNGDLRIDDSKRQTLLKFDLSAVPANLTSATLTWSIGKDSGEGSIVVSAGSHSDWTERDENLLPDISHHIGSFNGIWNNDTRYGLPLDYTLLDDTLTTLVLAMEQGANGLAIVPASNDQEVRLELTGSSTFCDDYSAISTETDTSDITAPVTTEPLAAAANEEQQESSSGSGTWALLEILLAVLFQGWLSRKYPACQRPTDHRQI